MSFRPKLVVAEDSPLENAEVELPEDFELPRDLQALATRLQSEACELSRQFPAGERDPAPVALNPAPGTSTNGRRTHPIRWPHRLQWIAGAQWFAGAGSLLAAGALAVVLIAPPRGPAEGVGRFGAAAWSSPNTTAGSSPRFSAVGLPAVGAVQRSAAPIGAAPALFLQEVSGPELEGLLDLMEDDGQSCDISI